MNKLNRIFAAVLIFTNIGFFNFSVAAQSKKTSTRSTLGKATPTVFDNPTLVKRYQQQISPDTLASRLYFLASDFFEGRETGARGQRLAAQYLASQYRLMGLAPKGNGKTADRLSPSAYFQPLTLYRGTPQKTRLEVSAGGNKIASSDFSAETRDDLSYFLSGNAKNASGGVIFAGYGIADDKLGYNDYAALSAKGISIDDKWVLILADEPLADAATSLLPTTDKKPSLWSTQFPHKRRVLLNAGRPKGLLIVSDSSPRNQIAFAENATTASANARRIGQVSLFESSDISQTYAVSTKLANQILYQKGSRMRKISKELKISVV